MIEALLMGGSKTLDVENVFSTTLYTGNGSSQTITNGIDLAGEGGLVWLKVRNNSYNHYLFDTYRGPGYAIYSNSSNTQTYSSVRLANFNDNGFTLALDTYINSNNHNYVSWTFRQTPKFFDIVQYTGDGTAGRQISHNLGIEPGMINTKSLSTIGDWNTYHHSATGDMVLNSTAAQAASKAIVESATDSTFTVSGVANSSGVTYIAYLFAHDPSDSGIIQCGSYTGNGSSNGPVIDLGWEPQYLLVKCSSNTGNWNIFDSARGAGVGTNDKLLRADSSNAETGGSSYDYMDLLSSGFQPKSNSQSWNGSGYEYIYMAISAPE